MLKPTTNLTRSHPNPTYERIGFIFIGEDHETRVIDYSPRVYMDRSGKILDEVVLEGWETPFRLPNSWPGTVILE